MTNYLDTIDWKIKGIYNANARRCYEEIKSIGETYTPAQIVDKARDKNTELHKLFEWNDGIAAEKYREVQARNVIRMLVVKQKPCDEVPEPHMVRVIVSRNEGNHQYQPVQVTVRSEDSYQKLLAQAICELEAFKRKYQALAELEFIIEEIEKLIE